MACNSLQRKGQDNLEDIRAVFLNPIKKETVKSWMLQVFVTFEECWTVYLPLVYQEFFKMH